MTSIDTLPDDVLLEVFNFHGDLDHGSFEKGLQAWQRLVHVCRRWRCIVFESPRHLNLQLVCTGKTPARDMLDIWPALPIIISAFDNPPINNINAALECTDRICAIYLGVFWSLDFDLFSPFCGEAKRSRRTSSLSKQGGRHVTCRLFLRAAAHLLARSIAS